MNSGAWKARALSWEEQKSASELEAGSMLDRQGRVDNSR
jgi:hypothetical protein